MTLFLSLFYVKFENIIHNFQYSPPGYTKLSSLIGKTSDLVIDQMKTSLKAMRRVSITTDCWSGKGSVDNYLGVVAHEFDTSTGQRKSLKLGKYL